MSDLTCNEVSAAVEKWQDRARQWLMDAIAQPSIQGQEQGVQELFKNIWDQEIGILAEYAEIPADIINDPEYTYNENQCPYAGRYNVVANAGGHGQGHSIILQSHTDVIPGGDWKAAFSPKYEDGWVWGRGATDCKGPSIMQMLAAAALQELGVKLAGKVQYQYVIEEEVGGNGALALIRQGNTAEAAVISEASGLNVFPANRGAVWFKLRTTGISRHMGRRDEAVNAIEKMMEALRWILAYEQQLITESRNYPLFERYEAPVQTCIGMINAGNWPSMIPEECVVEGGIGFLPNKDIATVKREVVEWINKSDDEWLKSHFEMTFGKLHNDAYESDPTHPAVTTLHQSCLDCGLDSEVYGWNVSCDARLYSKLLKIPTMVYGPSDISYGHSDNERIEWNGVVEGAKALALALARWCGTV